MTPQLVLASASPRRLELLAALGFDFEVAPSDVDEEAVDRRRPEALARALARAKARDVAAGRPGAAVVGADTVVVHRGVMLAKPRDAAEAREMLQRLRGRRHRVITGVCLVSPAARPRVDHTVTSVLMRRYSDLEIEDSIARGDPFDKAGAYAIQDRILSPVAAFEGCYCNVMGLPLWPVLALLETAGIRPVRPHAMPEACRTCVTQSKHHS